jgi:hypothetical protein
LPPRRVPPASVRLTAADLGWHRTASATLAATWPAIAAARSSAATWKGRDCRRFGVRVAVTECGGA